MKSEKFFSKFSEVIKKSEKRKKSFGGESIKEKRERWMRADDEALRKSDSDKDRGRKRERKKEKEG